MTISPVSSPSGNPNPSEPEFVDELDLVGFDREQPPWREKRPRPVETTRSLLAFLMLGLLAVVILALMGLLAWEKISADEFSTMAGVLIAPLVGLLGAATGYYYGRGK